MFLLTVQRFLKSRNNTPHPSSTITSDASISLNHLGSPRGPWSSSPEASSAENHGSAVKCNWNPSEMQWKPLPDGGKSQDKSSQTEAVCSKTQDACASWDASWAGPLINPRLQVLQSIISFSRDHPHIGGSYLAQWVPFSGKPHSTLQGKED